MDKISAPRRDVAEAITLSCVRVPASKAAPLFLVCTPCPCKLLEFGTAQNLYGSKSRAARGHPSDAGRARELDGMAAVLARRGRWMCSTSATAALSSEELIQMERDCSAHNYHPIPMVFSKGEGAHIVDPEGNKYIDFLSAYSAANQGHCHPKVLRALIEQAQRLTLSSRAFHNDKFPIFAEYLTSMFGYEMMLPMNTGAEGVESAIKLARKWGYEKKKIPKNEV